MLNALVMMQSNYKQYSSDYNRLHWTVTIITGHDYDYRYGGVYLTVSTSFVVLNSHSLQQFPGVHGYNKY